MWRTRTGGPACASCWPRGHRSRRRGRRGASPTYCSRRPSSFWKPSSMARRVDGVGARNLVSTQEREARHTRRLVAAVFARWVRVRRFRRAARDFLRARGCVEINQCVDDAAVPAPSGGEEPAPSRYRASAASMASRSTRRFSMDAVTFRFPCRRAASSGGGRASSRDAASGAGGRAGARRLYLQRRSRNTTESGRRAVYLARTRSGASTRPTPNY